MVEPVLPVELVVLVFPVLPVELVKPVLSVEPVWDFNRAILYTLYLIYPITYRPDRDDHKNRVPHESYISCLLEQQQHFQLHKHEAI